MPSTMPGTISGSNNKLLTTSRPRKRPRTRQTAAGTPPPRPQDAAAEPDRRRDDGDLEAEQESRDEAVISGNGAEPFQRIALGRKRGDLLLEERQPDHEDHRQQDIGQGDAGRGAKRHAADPAR